MSRRVLAGALAVGGALVLAGGSATAAPTLWERVLRPHEARCAALREEASRQQVSQPFAAANALATATTLCADDRDAWQELGELRLGSRDFTGARAALERARALVDAEPGARPPSATAREAALAFDLGLARAVTGDLEGALVEHRRAEALGGLTSSTEFLLHYNLGDDLMALGRLGEAIDEYRQAVRLGSDKPMPRLALAVALDRDGQVDRARAELTVALSLDPQMRKVSSEDYVFVPPAEMYYYLALGHLGAGQVSRARGELRAFLAGAAAGPYAARARERLAVADRTVDARELTVSDAGIDSRALAAWLGPLRADLEGCAHAPRPEPVRLVRTPAGLRAARASPFATCLDDVLARRPPVAAARAGRGWVELPLGGNLGTPLGP